jgi:hypothetical protein
MNPSPPANGVWIRKNLIQLHRRSTPWARGSEETPAPGNRNQKKRKYKVENSI